jgi:GT2 family glycosyltransferase
VAEAPLVAAIVLNFRLPEATARCVADLQRSGHARLRTLVLDNGSGDGAVAWLERELRGAELIALPRNLGYCTAMNLGLDWARRRGADHVLLLNNDMRLPDGFLAPLVDVLAHDAEVGGVGPTVLRPDGNVWCQGARVGWHANLVRLLGEGRAPAPQDEGPAEVDFLPGACALYRLADLDAIGGFDDDYFMYWEDADLAARLRARGLRVVWVPWTRVVHEPSASSGGGRTPVRKYLSAANAVRYLRAHGSARLWAAWLLFEVLGLPLALLTGTSPRAVFAKACGVLAGLRERRLTAADVERWLPRASRAHNAPP